MKFWIKGFIVFVVTIISLNCSEDSSDITGGASETEAGIQVSVIQPNGNPLPQAKVWVSHRNIIGEAIDELICNQEGVCHISGLPDGQYLLRSDSPNLTSMAELNIQATQATYPNILLQLEKPSTIQIESFPLNTMNSKIRIGVAGFNQWDTTSVNDSWTSGQIAQGEHILVVEGLDEVQVGLIDFYPIKLTLFTVLEEDPLVIPSIEDLIP